MQLEPITEPPLWFNQWFNSPVLDVCFSWSPDVCVRLPALWNASLVLKTVVKKPKGKAPMPNDMWKPVSPKPWNICTQEKKNTKLKQKQEVCLNNAASTEKHRLAVFERKWWNGKRTHPASALWLCSLSLRPRWSFQPEHRRRRTIIESNRDISTIIDTRTRVHLGSSWLELPRPYSGMTLSLLMPALHTGHCCLLGCVSNH